MTNRILIVGQHGLGDCINARPLVIACAERADTFLATPWPQLYDGVPEVKCVRAKSKLRTQAKNESQTEDSAWHEKPNVVSAIVKMTYNTAFGNLHAQLEQLLPLDNGQQWKYELPAYPRPAEAPLRPYAVLRPATVRAEWRADSRNPDPEYLCRIARVLRDRGLLVVLVADLKDEVEWLLGEKPEADVEFLHGELSIRQLLGLIRHAAINVGGGGFLAHAAMALRSPSLTVYGGRMGFHSPEKDLPVHRHVDTLYECLTPHPRCNCHDSFHACNKHIPDFDQKLAASLKRLLVALP